MEIGDELPRDSNGKSPLEVALEEGHRKASKEFLQRMKSFDLNLCIDDKSEDSLLHLAAEIGNIDLFNSILEEPGDAKVRWFHLMKQTNLETWAVWKK